MKAPVRQDLRAVVGEPLDFRFALRTHDAFHEPVGVPLAGVLAFWRLFAAAGLTPALYVGVSQGTQDRCLVVDVEHSEIRLAVPAARVAAWTFEQAWYELWAQWPGEDDQRKLAVGKLRRRAA